MTDRPGSTRYQSLAQTLSVLASPVRLDLLHALRTPLELNEIRLPADDGRPLARQTVTHHLDTLLDAGLVRRISPEGRTRGSIYVLNHPQMFAAVDEMRGLARLKPAIVDDHDGATLDARDNAPATLPPRPRLAVAYGRDNGLAYALSSSPGARSAIGRDAACEIVLDYDPYISGRHALVERIGEKAHALRDAGSRNGTWLNWRRLAPDEIATLEPGDLVTVGRTVLTYQP